MPDIRYLLAIHGSNATGMLEHSKSLFSGIEKVITERDTHFVIQDIYPTGLPNHIVWRDNIGLLLHGIAFPKDFSLDELATDPDHVLGSIIEQYRNNLERLPYAFLNGSFVGIILDRNTDKIIAFTSFLNTIPFYYAVEQDTLLLSTSFKNIVYFTGRSMTAASKGMLEYYHLGTNLSDLTPVDGIKSIPKGAYIEYADKKLKCDFYYTMPAAEENRSFNSWVEEFSSKWDTCINGLHSKTFNYGLGLTGGLDSRVILAGIEKKKEVLYFTGSHKDNPDYILARKLTESLGISDHHVLEDYSHSDFTKGYVDYLAISDNPIYNNKVYNIDQVKFRQEHGLTYELIGLTEFLGGVYHYTDRRKISNMVNMGLPLKLHSLDVSTPEKQMKLAYMGLRNTAFEDFKTALSGEQIRDYEDTLLQSVQFLNRQINTTASMENYLERFRHIHKMANLLSWNRLNGRGYVELLSPSMNIEMTDLAARIPLKHRDSRKILLAYLKRYHPQLSRIVLSGYIFSANAPWSLYKFLSPYIKVMNHLGIKVPFLQWYINADAEKSFINQKEIRKLQTLVVSDSDLIRQFLPTVSNEMETMGSLKLMRLFNIALLDKRLNLDDQAYRDYLYSKYDMIK